MQRFTIPPDLKNYSLSLVPSNANCVVLVARHYDDNFINNYVTFANNGGFAKTSNKAFPLLSDVHIFYKRERPLVDFVTNTVEHYDHVYSCFGLENGNCIIPEGLFELDVTYSSKFRRELPVVMDVPKRSGIRIHPGNFAADSSGCILLGKQITDNSVKTSQLAVMEFISKLKTNVPDRTCICICDYNKVFHS